MKRRMDRAVAQASKVREFAEGEKYADSTTLNAMDNATRNALRTGDYAGESQRVRDLDGADGRAQELGQGPARRFAARATSASSTRWSFRS